jgi:hypothetical protein
VHARARVRARTPVRPNYILFLGLQKPCTSCSKEATRHVAILKQLRSSAQEPAKAKFQEPANKLSVCKKQEQRCRHGHVQKDTDQPHR